MRKKNAHLTSIKEKFEVWYRKLTKNQLLVFWPCIFLSVITIMLNNPSEGYMRNYECVKVRSIDEARSKWSDQDPDKIDKFKEWDHLSNWHKKYRNNNNWAPEDGFFYPKKNPIWWIYAYESNAYKDWIYKDDFLSSSVLRFKTLGGLVNFLILVALGAKTLMWIVEIRRHQQ